MDDNTPDEQGLEADDQSTASEAGAAPEVDEGETETSEDSGAKPAEKPDGIQRRIDELTRKRYEAEREASYWRGKAEGHKPEAAQAQAEAEPQQESYESYEEYVRAVARWEVSQSLATERTRIEHEHRAQAAVRDYDTRAQAVREKHADFDQVVYNPDLAVSEIMRDAILRSEDGAKLAYHLGQHPEEAAHIANMEPFGQVMAIGRLAAKLDAKPRPTAAASSAPAPITPVKASAPATTGLREDLSVDDWMRRRHAQLRKR
ncbi:MAG: hypothetical protein ACREVW_02250 [Burkholderiales bacterium]